MQVEDSVYRKLDGIPFVRFRSPAFDNSRAAVYRSGIIHRQTAQSEDATKAIRAGDRHNGVFNSFSIIHLDFDIRQC